MPSVNFNLEDSYVNISRPTVLDVTKTLQQLLKLDIDAKLIFPSEFGTLDQRTESGIAASVGDKKIFIEYTEEYAQESISATAIGRREYPPIFTDSGTGVYIKPVYGTTNLSIDYKLKSTSKVEAFKWYDRMRVSVSAMQEMNLHTIAYHYTIPEHILMFLEMIHEYRESVAPYNQTLTEYYTTSFCNRLTSLSDLAGGNVKLAIQEQQSRIVGLYEFEPLPDKPEKDNDTGLWAVGFKYKLTYEKPMAFNIEFPVMVHNQLLPKSLINLDRIPPRYYYASLSIYTMFPFELEQYANQYLDNNLVLRLPAGDQFSPTARKPNTLPLFYCLCSIEDDQVTILSLKELGDVMIDNVVLSYIQANKNDVFNINKTFYQLTVYRNDNPLSMDQVYIDDELVIRSRIPLNLRDIHRVELSIATELTALSTDTLMILKNDVPFLARVVSTLNEVMYTYLGPKSRTKYDYRYFFELFITRLKVDLSVIIKNYLLSVMGVDNATVTGVVKQSSNGVVSSSNGSISGVRSNPMYQKEVDAGGYYLDLNGNRRSLLLDLMESYIRGLYVQSKNGTAFYNQIVPVTSALRIGLS